MNNKPTADQIIRHHRSEQIVLLSEITVLKNTIEEKEKRLGEISVIISTAEMLKPGPEKAQPENAKPEKDDSDEDDETRPA